MEICFIYFILLKIFHVQCLTKDVYMKVLFLSMYGTRVTDNCWSNLQQEENRSILRCVTIFSQKKKKMQILLQATVCSETVKLNWAEILLVYIIFLDVASGESLLHWEPSAYVWISVLSSSISRILAQNLLSSPSSCLYIINIHLYYFAWWFKQFSLCSFE